MATISGGGSNGHHTFYLNLSESNVDTANNRSTVNWNFQITGQSGWDFYDIGSTIVITINGTQVYNAYAQRSYGGSGTATWASGSIVVPHNSDGSKTISASFSYSQSSSSYYTPGNASGSGNMTLTKINRYAVTNSVNGTDLEGIFKVNYTKYVNDYKYKVRISFPKIEALDYIDYNTSGEPFTLSNNVIEKAYDRYPDTNTFQLGFAVETWNNAGTQRIDLGNEVVINCTKTDRIGRLFINNEWKRSVPYVRINGEWVKAIPYTRINNEWKRGR
jgi:hypothetical protein